MDVAKSLQESDLQMKVTERSCRDRVNDLLKSHQKDELASIRASGISEEEMSELKNLLTNVAKLKAAKPNKQLKSLYSRNDRDEAEAIRAKAVQQLLSSENPLVRERVSEELEIAEYENRKRSADKSKDEEENDENDKEFEFGPKEGRCEGPSNPKHNLVKYLEKKNQKDVMLRKEELRLREKEVEIKAKKMENQTKEVENKAKEMEIMRIKVEAEIEERKKFTELIMKLATQRQ